MNTAGKSSSFHYSRFRRILPWLGLIFAPFLAVGVIVLVQVIEGKEVTFDLAKAWKAWIIAAAFCVPLIGGLIWRETMLATIEVDDQEISTKTIFAHKNVLWRDVDSIKLYNLPHGVGVKPTRAIEIIYNNNQKLFAFDNIYKFEVLVSVIENASEKYSIPIHRDV